MTGRFSEVALPGAPDEAAPAAPATATRDRFAPAPERPVTLEAHEADGERPSVRCLECGAENGRYAARCACGAGLGGRAVVRLNRRLWQEELKQVVAGRDARREAQRSEVEGLAAQRRERGAVVDAAFEQILDEERRRCQLRVIDRLGGALAFGPMASWSTGARRAVVVAAALTAVALLSLLPGGGPRLLQLGLVVLLVGTWVKPA